MTSAAARAAAPAPASDRGRRAAALLASLVLGAIALVGLEATSPAPAAAATSGCRPVGGGPVDTGGGPNRATVVVDTGSGAVWAACVSFSGTISGIEALDRAAAQIPDLSPVYDQYSGLGRAVCRLRGVGTDPPDCLGKSTSYWSFSVNGRVASVGAGSVTLRDGDVHGWRHGTGGAPRPASAGTEATSAPPPTTTTTRPASPTTQPAPPTTRPPATVPGGSGGSGSTGGLGGSSSGSGGSSDGASTGAPGSDAGDGGGTGTTVPGDGGSTDPDAPADGEGEGTGEPGAEDADEAASSSSDDGDAADGAVDGDGDQQAAAGAAGSTGSGGGSDGGSSMGSAIGFLVALGLVGAGALVVRRRRLAAAGPTAVSDPTPA